MNTIKLVTFIFLSIFCSIGSIIAQKNKKKQRPNIVVILSDDIGFEEFGIYKVKKGEVSNTPNIDKLGEVGVAFKTAYAQSICGPSRAMFYSGNYAMHNGAYDNKIKYRPEDKGKSKDLEKFPNYVRVLHDAGYKTAVAGRWHNPIGGMLGLNNDIYIDVLSILLSLLFVLLLLFTFTCLVLATLAVRLGIRESYGNTLQGQLDCIYHGGDCLARATLCSCFAVPLVHHLVDFT